MSLPPILLFESHSDPTTRLLACEMLPKLKEIGYRELCVEMPQEMGSEQIIDHVKGELERAVEAEGIVKFAASKARISHLELSQKTELEVSELLTSVLPPSERKTDMYPIAIVYCRRESNKAMLNLFRLAVANGLSLQGIDVCAEALKMRDPARNFEQAIKLDRIREATMATHIEKLRSRGVIFICGAVHAKRIIDQCKEVLYFFPRSKKWQPIEDAALIRENNIEVNFLKDPSLVIFEPEIPLLAERFLLQTEILKCLKEVPKENQQTRLLKRVFKVGFRLFLRPDFYAVAFLPEDEAANITEIEARLKAVEVPFNIVSLKSKAHLVIQNINAGAVAQKIFRLKPVV